MILSQSPQFDIEMANLQSVIVITFLSTNIKYKREKPYFFL